jgi:hypothetical protein
MEEYVWPFYVECIDHRNLQVTRVVCFTFGVCNFAVGTAHTSKYADTLVGINLLTCRNL